MENGLAGDIAVFCGDEKEDKDFIGVCADESCDSSNYYKIDFANIGIPIYMTKSNVIPSNYRTMWQAKCKFFLQNTEDGSAWELSQMEIGKEAIPPNSSNLVLVQIWFKEVEGKVYTLCLYHAFDYNYVLSTYLLEEDKIEQIRTDIFSPQRQFVLTEGEVFFSG